MEEHKDKHSGRSGSSSDRWFVGGYLAPTLVVLFTIFWVLTHYWLIGDRPRHWQYGAVPYVPAESEFSSRPIPYGPPIKQVVLPKRNLINPKGRTK